MDYAQNIAQIISARRDQVDAAIRLLDEGNTIPFIARYRKEATSNLDEEQLRAVEANLERLRTLDERKTAVLQSIEEQGKLSLDLKEAILAAVTLTQVEDLYQPYRPKRRTRASIARERGLEGLANMILAQAHTSQSIEELAKTYLKDDVPDIESALQGARDIAAEAIADDAEVRRQTREKMLQWGVVKSEKVEDSEDEKRVYEVYYEFEFRVDRLRPYQVLAINRGEKEKVLRLWVHIEDRDWLTAMLTRFRPDKRSVFCQQMEEAMRDSAERLLIPSIERDVRRTMTESAELHAINVFASNLRNLLNQPPLAGYVVMGIDPGFRTGCKVAVVDGTGKVLDTVTIYPHEPQKKMDESLSILDKLVQKHGVSLISIGNGTASRETETMAARLTKNKPGLHYVIVNEAGASVYSASPLARAELPGLDVSMRGAVSIARRIQDPLAELVKIDPKSIGVGLYQHDVDQKLLAGSLTSVVESVVNQVGVDVNTASPALLENVAGIGPKLAENIVLYRDENGPFKTREELKKVPKLGPKAFEQSAGFLRIRNGANPLDSSAIHPESYKIAEKLIRQIDIDLKAPPVERKEAVDRLLRSEPLDQLANRLEAGSLTLKDILDQLVRPGRDPREDLPQPILRSDVLKMEDLGEGMELKGTVRNVVDFGAFIDIGVKQDGLLHRTQVPFGTELKVGMVIDVTILKIEPERGRISLGWAGD